MVHALLAFAIGLFVLGVGELWRRKAGLGNEVSRKLVHSVHGTIAAYLPFAVGYTPLIWLELFYIALALITRRLHLFGWLWRVGRVSLGPYTFPVGVIIAALLAESKGIFAAAVLQLALADAIAAIVGKTYGKHPYKILGQNKSVQGTLAFVAMSAMILVVFTMFSTSVDSLDAIAIIGLAVVLSAVENIGVYGLDNFLIPVATTLALNWLV